MHGVQIVDKAFHCLMRILLCLLVRFLCDACQVFLVNNDLQGYQGDAQCLAFCFGRFDRRQMFLD